MPATARGLEAFASCFFHASTAVREVPPPQPRSLSITLGALSQAAASFFDALERYEMGKAMIAELPMYWQLGRSRCARS